MLYNKDLNRKINEKKVLHKVKKHWVVVSVAILGLMGATGVTKNSIHASSVNANHQNHNLVQTNANQKNQAQTLIKPQTNQSSLHLGPVTGQQSQSVHQPKLDQITKQTDVLRNRILAQVNQNSQTPQQHLNRSNVNVSQHAADYYGRSTSASTNNVSVTSSQVSHAASSAQQHQQVVNLAKQQMKQLGQEEPAQTENLGASPITVDEYNAELNNATTDYENASQIFSDLPSKLISNADSEENEAACEISRYSWIDPQSVDANPSDVNYGSETAGYGFSDSSDAASTTNDSLKSNLAALNNKDMLTVAITASVANKDIENLFISDEAGAQKNQASLTSVSNVMSYASSVATDYSVSASTTMDQISGEKSGIISDFATVSSKADSFGKFFSVDSYSAGGRGIDLGAGAEYQLGPSVSNHLPNNTMSQESPKEFAIVNAYNIYEFLNATFDPYVKKINIMNNMEAWDLPDVKTYYPDVSNDRYMYPAMHNCMIDGINPDGTSNTVDMAKENINWCNYGPVYNGKVTHNANYFSESGFQNIHLYGVNWWGPMSSNTHSNIVLRYDNISYCGTQLAYNTDKVSGLFQGKIRANCGASYSPDGAYQGYYKPDGTYNGHMVRYKESNGQYVNKFVKYPGYGYDSDGISPYPYVGDKKPTDTAGDGSHYDIALTEDPKTPGDTKYIFKNSKGNEFYAGINTASKQQLIQLTNASVFASGCDVVASTEGSNCIEFDGSGQVVLQNNANVKLIPRGVDPENYGPICAGVLIDGKASLNIGAGATLNITPSIATYKYCNNDSTADKYAPSAIRTTGAGSIHLNNGGHLYVSYPDIDQDGGYSLPDGTDNYWGAVSMAGPGSTIEADPYSILEVNGGNPTNKAGNKGNGDGTSSGNFGSLVSYGDNQANTGVIAKPESTISLDVGGSDSNGQPSQPIELFVAGNTIITVTDPKQFSLEFDNNDNPNTQLASSKVGIQGIDVTAYDQHRTGSNFDHYFGQYNRIVFPGSTVPLSQEMVNNISSRITAVENYILNYISNVTKKTVSTSSEAINYARTQPDPAATMAQLEESQAKSQVDSAKNLLPPVNTLLNSGYDENGVSIPALTTILPQGTSDLTNAVYKEYTNTFNDSIDLENLIVQGANAELRSLGKGNIGPHVDTGNSFWGSDWGPIPMYTANGTYSPEEEKVMIYDHKRLPILANGFNLQHGFAFKEVPHTNVEGVQLIKDQKTGDQFLQGYAIPGSYIRLNNGNDPSDPSQYYPQHAKNPVYIPGETYDTKTSYNGQPAYDPSDNYKYHDTYVAVADNTGYWKCKLPFGVDLSDQNQTNPLVVTAHTESVLSPNAARWVARYNDGINNITELGDTPDNANLFDKNQGGFNEGKNGNPYPSSNDYPHGKSFPLDTYPTNNNETPADAKNGSSKTDSKDANASWSGQPIPDYGDYDPTFTDDDDDVTVSVSGSQSDHVQTLPILSTDLGGRPIRKGADYDDDYNAGNYFWAGRLKGVYDVNNLNTDPSIYGMPFPFIVGYITAKAAGMNANQMEADINQIIAYVQNIKHIVVTDYLPAVERDKSSADTSMANINETISNLDGLLSPMQTTDPYLNLKPLSSDFVSPSSSDQTYDSLVNDEYNSVSGIDDQLDSILSTLNGDKANITLDGFRYNHYVQLAKSAAKNLQDAEKQAYIIQAKTYSSNGSDLVSGAWPEESSANSYDSHASIYNQSASSNSNSMVSSYDYIRGTASNNEAADYNSVAQSYSGSAQLDSADVYRDSTEVSHRDRQLSVANGILDDDEAQINEITNSLENYVPVLSSLSGLGGAVGAKLSASYSSDYSAANSALDFLTKLEANATNEENSDNGNSGTANQDSDAATSASNDVANHAQTLSTEAKLVSQFESAQNSLVSNSSFDQAQFINNEAAQSLDSVTDSQASSDVSLASSAWVEIHNLHDKIANVATAVEGAIPTFETDIQDYTQLAQPSSTSQASSQSASQITSSAQSSKRSQDSNSAANHGDVARDRYQGTLTVTVQDEDTGGHPTSRDIETVAVDQQLGTRLTLDPQQYRPAGFHLAADDRPISIRVTRQGAVPQNVTFRYRIDHDNDSNGVPQSASQVASVTSDPMSVRQPSSVSIASDSSSSQSTDNEEAPIWIDGTPNESSNASLNNNASASVTSFNALQSSASAVPQLAESESVSELQSDSSSTNSSIAVRSQTDRSLVEKSAWSSLSSAVSHSSSLVSHLASSSVASSRGAQRSSLAVIRHQFLQHYEHRALGIPSSARNQGARIADRYIAGINDARKDVRANTKDSFYHKGRRAFKEARIRSMASQPRQIHEHWTLGAVLMLILYTILRGWVAADHRRNEE